MQEYCSAKFSFKTPHWLGAHRSTKRGGVWPFGVDRISVLLSLLFGHLSLRHKKSMLFGPASIKKAQPYCPRYGINAFLIFIAQGRSEKSHFATPHRRYFSRPFGLRRPSTDRSIKSMGVFFESV